MVGMYYFFVGVYLFVVGVDGVGCFDDGWCVYFFGVFVLFGVMVECMIVLDM